MPKIQKYEHQKEKINKDAVDKHKIIHKFSGEDKLKNTFIYSIIKKYLRNFVSNNVEINSDQNRLIFHWERFRRFPIQALWKSYLKIFLSKRKQ